MSCGFIITRHVNSEKTNLYWNHCIKCIRTLYSPEKYKIVVIDDNSNQQFLKKEFEYKNVEYIQSEFPGRGELLPYYYFYKHHFFDNAVIIHDSVFIHKRIHLSKIKAPVLPLWYFTENHNFENVTNTLSLINVLNNNIHIKNDFLDTNQYQVLSFNNSRWYGCFGVQCYINHNFLSRIQEKYNLFNLLHVVKNRPDRCCLERIFGSIFYKEFPDLIKVKSLLGDIMSYGTWGYSWDEYKNKFDKKITKKIPIIKVWTGR
jgi:hypothetical protein